MAKRFCGNGFALVKPATPFSSSARTAIGDIATAANNAASKPAAGSGGAPIDVTNKAPKGSSIIVIVSGSTAAAFVQLNRQ
jgi:hypothetical protein